MHDRYWVLTLLGFVIALLVVIAVML